MKYIRDIVFTQRMLGVSYIHTSKNIADVMTKATEMVITFDFSTLKKEDIKENFEN